ncbi:tRNA pseudouridine(55) synthase TruB [Desulfosarcina sp. OttesenSCG-928-A07]|nr:tRNA pseudouridine(55) synthase TruB [Desulfosarcina sp. OttesenSCG-928-G17]MDL2328725.1 tRNA pseudouridine(55) synthase TruB [Desulfosarcina sp. OttesenSCG-928-A07]
MTAAFNGIVLVDKPAGISSAKLVSRVRAIFGAKKAGHTGTLDPLATGLMVCALNQATRISQFLLNGNKTYTAEMVLGTETDTQDATGRIVGETPLHGSISPEAIHAVAKRFTGTIEQIPPAYSALKHQGTPLYRLARKGIVVEKPARSIEIHHLTISAIDLPRVRFSVSCSAGTYIRTLCADMGRALGCGAHLAALQRTASCGFSLDQALTLETLTAFRDRDALGKAVIPMNAALPDLPEVWVDDRLAQDIWHGRQLALDHFPVPAPLLTGAPFRVVAADGRLIAIMNAGSAGYYNYCCVFSP